MSLCGIDRRFLPLLAALLVLCAVGCSEEEHLMGPPVYNEISELWAGVYEGRALFVNPSLDIKQYEDVKVRIYDLGYNHIRIEANITSREAQVPLFRLEGLVKSETEAYLVQSNDVHAFSCSLHRATDRLTGALVVQELAGSIKCWSLTQIVAVK